MKTRLAVLVLGTLALWALVAIPARHLWGDEAAAYSAVAAGLCLVPSAATFVWAAWSLRQPPDQQVGVLVAVLGGTGARMFFVLGAGAALWAWLPYFHRPAFWIWLVVFYLLTLTLEMVLLVGGPATAESVKK